MNEFEDNTELKINTPKENKKLRIRTPLPKARISRFCHSKIDEIYCQNFLQFIQRYDNDTQKLIIQEALIPDISDVQETKHIGPRSALKSALG